MDISKLKDKIGDEMFAELERHIGDLTGQRDTARTESINGRKQLKTDLAAAQALAARALEKLGVDSADDLDTLPDAKGQGEALKQFETKLKRAERERDEANQRAEKADGTHRDMLWQLAAAKAIGKHEFSAPDLIATHIGQNRVWEGDKWMVKTETGTLVSIEDGVATVAKARPELLKPSGTGGAGVRQPNAGSGGERKMTRAEFEAAPAADRMAHVKAGGQVVDS